jgi:protein SCO1/2
MSRDERNAKAPPRAPKHGLGPAGGEAGSRPRGRWPWPRVILLAGGLLLATGLGMKLWSEQGPRLFSGPAPTAASTPLPSAVGGPFQLVDQNGRAANESLLQGKWTAIFFGYTFCPDVCPATLSALKVVKERLGPRGKDLQVVFVTVDPERDTPAQLRSYLSTPAFPQPIVGLTGTPAQIAAVAKAYKVYYAKRGTGRDYQMDHGSAIYLMTPKGQFHSLISDANGLDNMAAELGDAIGRS